MDPAILKTFTTAEEAFLCFASSKDGHIEKEELMRMMHEVGGWVGWRASGLRCGGGGFVGLCFAVVLYLCVICREKQGRAR